MEATARILNTPDGQNIRLPKQFNFNTDQVQISKYGDLLIVFPESKRESLFAASLGSFTEDFFHILENRHLDKVPDSPRESFD